MTSPDNQTHHYPTNRGPITTRDPDAPVLKRAAPGGNRPDSVHNIFHKSATIVHKSATIHAQFDHGRPFNARSRSSREFFGNDIGAAVDPHSIEATIPDRSEPARPPGRFSGGLPNFFCQQVTTRYQSDHPKTGWDALDIVTADVAYENGQESYKNIKVGNKVVNKNMEDIEGTRSTGEFASILIDLLLVPIPLRCSAAPGRIRFTAGLHGSTSSMCSASIPTGASRLRRSCTIRRIPVRSGSISKAPESSASSSRPAACRCCFLLTPRNRPPSTISYGWPRRNRSSCRWMPRF